MCTIALKWIKFCISLPDTTCSFHQVSAYFTCSDHFLPQIYEYVSVFECHAQMILQLWLNLFFAVSCEYLFLAVKVEVILTPVWFYKEPKV